MSPLPVRRCLSSFAIVGLGLAGCFGGGDTPAFQLDWGLVYIEGQAVSCADAGTKFVDLDVQNLSTKAVFHDRFECQAGGAVGSELPAGPYVVSVRLRDANGGLVSESAPVNLQVSRHARTDLGTVVFHIQSFSLAWSLARNSAAITCAQAGADKVELITQLGEGAPVRFKWPCTDRSGTTTAVSAGSYSVQVRLLDGGGGVLYTSEPMTFPVDDQHRANLPPITFVVK